LVENSTKTLKVSAGAGSGFDEEMLVGEEIRATDDRQ
jgi:hypothetical protein